MEEADRGQGPPTGPKDAHSTVPGIKDEAVILAFCHHTLLPLDDRLYALQATIPHRTRPSLDRRLQRHRVSRLTEVPGDKVLRRKFETYRIGYFHIDMAGAHTAEDKLRLFVAGRPDEQVRVRRTARAG